jgi:hypothetical protein
MTSTHVFIEWNRASIRVARNARVIGSGCLKRVISSVQRQALRSLGNSIVRLGLDRWNLGEDGVDLDLFAGFGAFAQVALGVQGGEHRGDCAADESIDGNALVARQSFGVLVD